MPVEAGERSPEGLSSSRADEAGGDGLGGRGEVAEAVEADEEDASADGSATAALAMMANTGIPVTSRGPDQ